MTNGNNLEPQRRRWLLVLLVLAGLLVTLGAYSQLRRKQIPVRATQVARGTLSSTISTNGKIEPVNNFEAHAPAPISVRRVLVHEGDRVKAGQLLVQLEDFDARTQAAKAQASLRGAEAELQGVTTGTSGNQAQLAKARTELDAARRNLEALQRLQQRGAASGGEIQAAQNRVNVAEADIRALEAKASPQTSNADVARAQAQAGEARAALSAANELLRDTNIRAPRDGMVYSLPVHEGQFVQAGDLIVAVADLSKVQVRAFVDEPEIGRLAPGQIVRVTWDALPGRVWQGTLTRVPTTVIQRGSRNVGEITTTIDNPDLKLLPNVNVSANVITAERNGVLTVPREAVHQHGGESHVYEIANGKLKQHNVTIGIADLTRIEIMSGVSEGTLVALGTMTNQRLGDGVPVRVVAR